MMKCQTVLNKKKSDKLTQLLRCQKIGKSTSTWIKRYIVLLLIFQCVVFQFRSGIKHTFVHIHMYVVQNMQALAYEEAVFLCLFTKCVSTAHKRLRRRNG